ncbi:catenin alpha-1 [Tachysurus ichikawai]
MVSQMETRTERKVDRKSVIDGWMGKNEPVESLQAVRTMPGDRKEESDALQSTESLRRTPESSVPIVQPAERLEVRLKKGKGPLKNTSDVISAAKKIAEAGSRMDKLGRTIADQVSVQSVCPARDDLFQL